MEMSEEKFMKIYEKRSLINNLFLFFFFIIGFVLLYNFNYSKDFYNASFWIISFDIVLLLVLAIKDFSKKIEGYAKRSLDYFIKIREKNFNNEMNFLREGDLRNAEKEFSKHETIYNLLSVIENKFILQVILSITLSLFYITSYFFLLELGQINKIIPIPIINYDFPLGNLILISVFFASLLFFIKSLFYIAYVLFESKEI